MGSKRQRRRGKRRNRKLRDRPLTSSRQRKRDKKQARKARKKWRPKTLADIMFHNQEDLIGTTITRRDDGHAYTIVEFAFGYVFECETCDKKDLLERETLFSRDGKIWTLLGRVRTGPHHNDDKWYPRDQLYPIGCKVRL
jgi:hypothetical protein